MSRLHIWAACDWKKRVGVSLEVEGLSNGVRSRGTRVLVPGYESISTGVREY